MRLTSAWLSALLFFAAALAAQPAQEPPAQRDYVIGPGDLLRVSVYDAPDLSREVRVSAEGFIRLPLLPSRVRADGLTPDELADQLVRAFFARQLLRDPQVTVLVKEYRSRPVAVLGAVRRPGMVPVFGPTTLLQVLSEAEGLTEAAGALIYVTRGGALVAAPATSRRSEKPTEPRTRVVKVRDLLEMRDPAANLPIYAGDMITVPRAGIIYVVGAVHKPGGFMLRGERERLTVLQAVALAENLTGTARPAEAVIVRRPSGSDKEEAIPVDIRKVMARKAPDPALEANDILFVPDSLAKKGLRRAMEAAIQIAAGVIIFRR